LKIGPISLKHREKPESKENVPAADRTSSSETIVATGDVASDQISIPGESLEEEEEQEELSFIAAQDEEQEEGGDGAFDRMSRFKDTTMHKLAPIGRAGKSQLRTFRAEGKDLKKLLSSKEILIYKTDAIAILLRKSGGLIEFLENYDKLIREGYVLSHNEPVDTFFEIPIAGVKTKLGKLYFFHHRKHTTSTPPPEPEIRGGLDQKQIASVFSESSLIVSNNTDQRQLSPQA
jgi:hypothetical protein